MSKRVKNSFEGVVIEKRVKKTEGAKRRLDFGQDVETTSTTRPELDIPKETDQSSEDVVECTGFYEDPNDVIVIPDSPNFIDAFELAWAKKMKKANECNILTQMQTQKSPTYAEAFDLEWAKNAKADDIQPGPSKDVPTNVASNNIQTIVPVIKVYIYIYTSHTYI